MKLKRKKDLTFGEFIMAAYEVWGASHAGRIVRSALNARLVVFRDQPQLWVASKRRSV